MTSVRLLLFVYILRLFVDILRFLYDRPRRRRRRRPRLVFGVAYDSLDDLRSGVYPRLISMPILVKLEKSGGKKRGGG